MSAKHIHKLTNKRCHKILIQDFSIIHHFTFEDNVFKINMNICYKSLSSFVIYAIISKPSCFIFCLQNYKLFLFSC